MASPQHQWDIVPQKTVRDPELGVDKAGSYSPSDHLNFDFLTAKGLLVF